MSQFRHLKDKFGNDMYFANVDEVKIPPVMNPEDYVGHLDRIRDIKLRDDDIIVVGFPKSGNNWTHHMVNMLQAGTTELPPLYEDHHFVLLDGLGGSKKLPAPSMPRSFFSHLNFRFLPRDVAEKKVKVVHVSRNPKDVLVSLWCHVSTMRLPLGYAGTWPQFFSLMLGEGFWYGNVFDYLKDWEAEMDGHPELPIFHCSFEETKRDTLGQVERLNAFLGTGRSREFCQTIVSTCTLRNMPVTRRVSEDMMRNTFLWKEEVESDSFYRKGIVGDWKNWFTVAQNDEFDQVYAAKMADSKRTFAFE